MNRAVNTARWTMSVVVPFLFLAASIVLGQGSAAPRGNGNERAIQFPDTTEYRTLVVDLHTHTVFSDGQVWPSIRVGEALRDGLDAVAITDHLEYQPHLADIPHLDRNRSFQEAVSAAVDADVLVISGSEITRRAPAGHMNAVFVQDANQLLRVSHDPANPSDVGEYYSSATKWPAQEAVRAANDQGAFVFWNHAWETDIFPDGIPVIPTFHRENAAAGLLHGIEIANGSDYSEEAFQIGLDHGLALIGVSDVHNLIAWDYEPHKGGHRPVTLVFAKERTADAIKEALFDQRTVVWYKNLLAGRAPQLTPLLHASLALESATYQPDTEILVVTVTNRSDVTFRLRNLSDYAIANESDIIEIPAHRSVELQVKTGTTLTHVELPFDVLNALFAPGVYASISLSTDVS